MICRNLSMKRPRLMNHFRFFHPRRFLQDTRGSLVPMFAIMLLVVIAMIGMGIDYTRASLANAKMQAALDATALALSQNAASLSTTDLATQANTNFNALYTGTALAASPTITASYSNVTNPQVVVSGTAVMKTFFLGLPPMNMSTANISASSPIAWANARLRV